MWLSGSMLSIFVSCVYIYKFFMLSLSWGSIPMGDCKYNQPWRNCSQFRILLGQGHLLGGKGDTLLRSKVLMGNIESMNSHCCPSLTLLPWLLWLHIYLHPLDWLDYSLMSPHPVLNLICEDFHYNSEIEIFIPQDFFFRKMFIYVSLMLILKWNYYWTLK